ncbi:MAG: hypothetical protein M5U34_32585 [Chloroflexi bacterium]|nr:hypothetical protein [Chloroflexota bacterium]
MRYESALLVVGLVAIVWAAWRSQALPMFTVYWIMGVLLLMVVQQGTMGNAALLILPLYLLLGAFSGAILGPHIGWHGWLLSAGLLTLWALMFVNSGRFLRQMLFSADDLSSLWIALFALAFALTLIFFALSWDSRATYQAVLLSVLLMLLFYKWGTAWWLGHAGANDPRETWVTVGSDAGVLALTDVIEDLSWQMSRSDRDVSILSAVDTPVLRWYLRDYVNAEIGKSGAAQSQPDPHPHRRRRTHHPGSKLYGADFVLTRTEPAERNAFRLTHSGHPALVVISLFIGNARPGTELFYG